MGWNKNRAISLIVALVLPLVACSNIYAPVADKTTDAAIFEDAMKALDDLRYDESITYFESLSAASRQTTEVREKYAGALAGKCGFSFAGFLNFMAGADFASTPFFKLLMNQYTGRVISPDHCRQAEAQIKAIWENETPSQSQKLFMVMLSMSKMGAYLRNKADVDGTGNLGDNSTDAGFNVCTNSSSTLTDDEIKEVVTGFSLMILNITDFLSSFSSSTSTVMTTIAAGCSVLSPNPCDSTDTADVTAGMVASMRDILNTSTGYTFLPIGIGSCVDPTLPGSCCP